MPGNLQSLYRRQPAVCVSPQLHTQHDLSAAPWMQTTSATDNSHTFISLGGMLQRHLKESGSAYLLCSLFQLSDLT